MARVIPNMQEALHSVRFPASVDDLVTHASGNGAAQTTIALLKRLPPQRYDNASEVNNALGKIEEKPQTEELWSTGGSQELEDEGAQSTTSPKSY